MTRSVRQRMSGLHSWAGLLVGWVLFAIFLTGSAAVLRPELDLWCWPELRAAAPAPDAPQRIVERMQLLAPHAGRWLIPVPTAREPVATVYWVDKQGFRSARLDGATGAPVRTRDTLGGEFFYRLHFQLFGLPVILGRWIVGLCSMLMLVAIVSGVIVHRRLFADFFTFRPAKGQRSWMDAHAATAVLALPFHLVITYSGLLLLATLLMPWGIQARYAQPFAFLNDLAGGTAAPAALGRAAPLTPLAPLLRQAERRWGPDAVRRIEVSNPNDAAARITLFRGDGRAVGISRDSLFFDGASGVLLRDHRTSPVMATEGTLEGLHMALFAPAVVRAFYVLWGLAGGAMVATGCILWPLRRRQKARPQALPPGVPLVEALNLGGFGGLPAAMAAFLCANRLLPVGMAQRADWEIRCFFLVWLLSLLHLPLLRLWFRIRDRQAADGRGHRAAWARQMAATAILFALLPLLDALTTGRGLPDSLRTGDTLMAAFDGGFLLLALLFATGAWLLQPAWAAMFGRVRAEAAAG